MPLAIVLRMRPLGKSVWQIPSEINLSSEELAVADSVNLAVAEVFTGRSMRVVDDESVVALFDCVDFVEA